MVRIMNDELGNVRVKVEDI